MAVNESPKNVYYDESVGTTVKIGLSMVDTLPMLVRGKDAEGNVCVSTWITAEQFNKRLIDGKKPALGQGGA